MVKCAECKTFEYNSQPIIRFDKSMYDYDEIRSIKLKKLNKKTGVLQEIYFKPDSITFDVFGILFQELNSTKTIHLILNTYF